MQKRLIFINAFMSIAQVFIVGITLFFLYRFLLKTIGVEQFGIWSLVLATTSIAQVANLGISGSIVKFVAKYSARGEYHNISKIIQTAVISLAVIIGFVVLLCYPLIEWFLSLIIPQKFKGYTLGEKLSAGQNLLLEICGRCYKTVPDRLFKDESLTAWNFSLGV
jgi:O-antigen/teichoic acid export membrane protein